MLQGPRFDDPLPRIWDPDARIGDTLVDSALQRAPAHRLVEIAEIGRVVAFLVGGAASGMTGDTIFIDAGLHNVA